MQYFNCIDICHIKVADCGTREFTDQKREEMSVSDFIGRWLEGSPAQCNTENYTSNGQCSVLYLKDWHFVKVSVQDSPLIYL